MMSEKLIDSCDVLFNFASIRETFDEISIPPLNKMVFSQEYSATNVLQKINNFHTMCDHSDRKIDISKYFEILQNISMPSDIRLDYVYHDDDMFGCPLLYYRNQNQPALVSVEQMRQLDLNSLDVRSFDMPESYFEYALFHWMAGKFRLFWHSLLDKIELITSYSDIRRIFEKQCSSNTESYSFATGTKEKIMQINFEPVVSKLSDFQALVNFKGLTHDSICDFYTYIDRNERLNNFSFKKQIFVSENVDCY